MYAIVRAGAKQQKVAVGDVIEIDKVTTEVGQTLTLPVVLAVDGETITSDAKALDKASVTVEVLGAHGTCSSRADLVDRDTRRGC